LFRSVTPAWSNYNLRELARVTVSYCVMAHVRAATQGLQVGEPNCHPFRRNHVAFMHNGDIGGFGAIRRPLLEELTNESFDAIRGTTDDPANADSLYTNRGRRYVCEDGVCRMLDPGEANGSAIMVSSEPLSADSGWESVPVNHLLRIESDLSIAREPIAA
jgi:predicted glutamine amidotransferase